MSDGTVTVSAELYEALLELYETWWYEILIAPSSRAGYVEISSRSEDRMDKIGDRIERLLDDEL